MIYIRDYNLARIEDKNKSPESLLVAPARHHHLCYPGASPDVCRHERSPRPSSHNQHSGEQSGGLLTSNKKFCQWGWHREDNKEILSNL